MMSKVKILLMEDDPVLRYALKEYIEMKGFEIVATEDGEEGVKVFKNELFDLCIIDVMMPKKDGFTAAKEIQAENRNTPFLFLTARSMKVDKLKGFKLGADDYLVKPIDEEELIARIEVIIRRHQKPEHLTQETYQIGKYSFSTINRRLSWEGKTLTITEKEAQLLKMLSACMGNLLTREEALLDIWKSKDYFTRRSMDVHIAKLRKYLMHDPHIKISNIHGKGFILEVDK